MTRSEESRAEFPFIQVTAFAGTRKIASGLLPIVAAKAKAVLDRGETAPVLIFDDQTSAVVEVDFRGLLNDVRRKLMRSGVERSAETRSAGRPTLGVVAREITLLPRHWDWLGKQRGGVSATLRRLIEQARRENVAQETVLTAREAVYRFITTMAGDAPGYEEAIRALFAGNALRFEDLTSKWAADVHDHAWRLAPAAFGHPPSPLDGVIPFRKREAVLRAAGTAFGGGEIESVERITKGGSGAGVFKIMVDKADYLLRIEGPPDGLRNPARQYACLKIAAEAGVAPRLLYADADNGVAVTDYIQTNPMPAETPRVELLRSLVSAVKILHAAPLFPALIDYLDGVGSLMGQCQATGILPLKAFQKHLQFYNHMAAAYPRNDPNLVSSHNDLNPGNVLFQKERAWIIDWESAFAADRYVDIAAIANFFATDKTEEEFVLQAYFGAALNDYHRARFFLMQQLNRIFYAMVTLNFAAAVRPKTRLKKADLEAATFKGMRGKMVQIDPFEAKLRFACALLNDAMRHFESRRFAEAIALVKGGTSTLRKRPARNTSVRNI